jgi:hypothetical protein
VASHRHAVDRSFAADFGAAWHRHATGAADHHPAVPRVRVPHAASWTSPHFGLLTIPRYGETLALHRQLDRVPHHQAGPVLEQRPSM